MNISELEDSFHDLQKFSDTQYKTIHELQTKIIELTQENKHLQDLLASNLPHLDFNNGTLGISNEQLICETQIFLLKQRAMTDQLNADETKRFATFVDVLQKIKSKDKVEDLTIKKMSTDNLLQLVKQDESINNTSTK